MTAAIDKRVIGVIPVVIDMLNMEASFQHHDRAYDSWASTLHNYEEMGFMRWAAQLGSRCSRESRMRTRIATG